MKILLCLFRLEREYLSINKRLNDEIEEKNKVIADLSERCKDNEKSCKQLQDELLLVRKSLKQFSLLVKKLLCVLLCKNKKDFKKCIIKNFQYSLFF